LSLLGNEILELEMLLTNCKYLDGLVIDIYDKNTTTFDYNDLLKILTESSPNSLFKFKFRNLYISLESLKLFLDNWKGRHPISL
jgi:hypothetical protein